MPGLDAGDGCGGWMRRMDAADGASIDIGLYRIGLPVT
jgi:hypothetical protein